MQPGVEWHEVDPSQKRQWGVKVKVRGREDWNSQRPRRDRMQRCRKETNTKSTSKYHVTSQQSNIYTHETAWPEYNNQGCH